MNISIWSDIRCPFCYIGKRKFEAALSKFPHKDAITIEWKSFELDPTLETNTNISSMNHFIESKGVDADYASEMFNKVTEMASEVGLNFNLNNVVVANSLNAHRLLHFSKSLNRSNELKEALLKAHLEEGKNIDDLYVLSEIASSVGIDKNDSKTVLTSEQYTYDVRQDQMEARNLGINGVPFFVINNKYGISGAQPERVFTENLEKIWEETNKSPLKMDEVSNDNACDINGNCN